MEIRASLEPTWSTIRQIRERIGTALADSPKAVREAAQMVSSELLENAIKYGEVVPEAPDINFVFACDGDRLKIVVSNGSTLEPSVVSLKQRVEELASAEDPAELYVRRLEQLMEDPGGESTGLGIYRIGLEGQFSLECTYENYVVTVTAIRSAQ